MNDDRIATAVTAHTMHARPAAMNNNDNNQDSVYGAVSRTISTATVRVHSVH